MKKTVLEMDKCNWVHLGTLVGCNKVYLIIYLFSIFFLFYLFTYLFIYLFIYLLGILKRDKERVPVYEV